MKIKWSHADLNRRPPACHAGALPTELWPLLVNNIIVVNLKIRQFNINYSIFLRF